ncbi:MAG: hypothetical protein JXP73_06900 [Deltaproteobacteria bacterium]|nr:hypothetical protein [Deltaproteobacteria bacterium]
MRILMVGLALLVATNANPLFAKGGGRDKGKKPAAAAADPNAVVAKAHGGKVWIITGSAPSTEGEDLSKWLSNHKPAAEVTKKPTEERWPITILAVFKKRPLKGPITLQFVDKKEPGVLVGEDSSQTSGGPLVFQEPYDIDANIGFNKGHTYIVKVGQLIKKRFVTYATGEVTLK